MDVPGNTFIGPDGFKEMSGWPTGVGAQPGRRSTPTWPSGLWARSEELTGVRLPALSPLSRRR